MEGIWSLQLSTLPLAAILSSKASGDAVGKKDISFPHDFQFVFQYLPTTLLILNDREGKQVHGIYLKTPYIIIFRFEQNIPKVLVLTRLVLEDTELPIKNTICQQPPEFSYKLTILRNKFLQFVLRYNSHFTSSVNFG